MFRAFFSATALKFVGAIFEIFMQVYITHKISQDLFGKYTYIIGTGALLFYILFGGQIKFIIKNISIGNNISKFQRQYKCFYVIPIGIILLGCSILLKNNELINIVAIALLMQIFMEQNAYLFGVGKPTKALIIEYIVLRSSNLIFLIFCDVFYNINLIGLILCSYLSYIISIIVQKIIIREKKENIIEKKLISPIKEIFIFQVIEIFSNIYSNIPRMFQYIIGGAQQTAFISISIIIRNVLTFISGPTVKVFFNDFANDFHKGDMKRLSENYQNSTRWQIYIIIPMFLSILVFPHTILKIFGSDYINAQTTILIIAIGTFIGILPGPLSNLFQMANEEKFELFIQILSFIIFLTCLCIFLLLNIRQLCVPISLFISISITTCIRLLYMIKKLYIFPYTLKEFIVIGMFIIFESIFLIEVKILNLESFVFIIIYNLIAVTVHFILSPNDKELNFIKSIIKFK